MHPNAPKTGISFICIIFSSLIEPDFGCEGIPENEEICCETVLEDVDSGDIITVKVPDAQLYEKCIAEGVFVEYKNGSLDKIK